MRFALLMLPHAYTQPGAPPLPDPEAVQQMMIFNNELADSGALISLEGFFPPDTATRVTFSEGTSTLSRGPFGDPHPIGGYWFIDVASQDEAVAWAQRVPATDGDVIEVRLVPELSEFPDDVQRLASDLEAKLER